MLGFLGDFWEGALLCFFLAVAVAFLDFHRFIVERDSGTIPVHYFVSPGVSVFCLLYAIVPVTFYTIAFFFPNGWLSTAFAFSQENHFLRAIAIVATSGLLTRSKLLSFGDRGVIGPEYVYHLLRGWAAHSYKTKSGILRSRFLERNSPRVESIERLDVKAFDFAGSAINHKSSRRINRLRNAIADVYNQEKSMPRDVYVSSILGVVVDYTDLRTARRWVDVISSDSET